MRTARICAALGASAVFLLLAAPPTSAGDFGANVEVTGEVECLDSGEAQITWTATVSLDAPAQPPDGAPVGFRTVQGAGDGAIVQFEGVQSGAATGAVTFDPFQQTVPDPSAFPVISEAVALVSGTTGGIVDLDVTVLFFGEQNPEESIELSGEGSVELPICEQPIVTEPTTTPASATSPAAETRPRFTG